MKSHQNRKTDTVNEIGIKSSDDVEEEVSRTKQHRAVRKPIKQNRMKPIAAFLLTFQSIYEEEEIDWAWRKSISLFSILYIISLSFLLCRYCYFYYYYYYCCCCCCFCCLLLFVFFFSMPFCHRHHLSFPSLSPHNLINNNTNTAIMGVFPSGNRNRHQKRKKKRKRRNYVAVIQC